MTQFWEIFTSRRGDSQRSNTLPIRFWFNCCVMPQSDIARCRIDRSLIGEPMDFRHVGHLGANDMSDSCSADTMGSLLGSKGSDEFGMPVPQNFRSHDIPIKAE